MRHRRWDMELGSRFLRYAQHREASLLPIQVLILILILILGRIPMRMIALKSSFLRVMILVTPMMLPLKLFGLRLPEVCGNGPCL